MEMINLNNFHDDSKQELCFVPEVIAMTLCHSFHGREPEDGARDRISRKRMHLEKKRDTMKLRRVGDRVNGLVNNFVSVFLALSFITLLSRSSFFPLHLSCS